MFVYEILYTSNIITCIIAPRTLYTYIVRNRKCMLAYSCFVILTMIVFRTVLYVYHLVLLEDEIKFRDWMYHYYCLLISCLLRDETTRFPSSGLSHLRRIIHCHNG